MNVADMGELYKRVAATFLPYERVELTRFRDPCPTFRKHGILFRERLFFSASSLENSASDLLFFRFSRPVFRPPLFGVPLK